MRIHFHADMPRTRVVFYKDDDGSVPMLEWLDALSPRARVKCRTRLERLKALGHELRRPEADLLRDGIHELRASLQGTHYRMLYFFHSNQAIVVSHGLTKESMVPPVEIERAIARKTRFLRDPARHIGTEA